MRLAYQLDLILKQLDASDFADVPAADRQRISALCRRAADLARATPKPDAPRSGVLCDLHLGIRAE